MTQDEINQRNETGCRTGYSLFCWLYNATLSDLGCGVKDLTTGCRIIKLRQHAGCCRGPRAHHHQPADTQQLRMKTIKILPLTLATVALAAVVFIGLALGEIRNGHRQWKRRMVT